MDQTTSKEEKQNYQMKESGADCKSGSEVDSKAGSEVDSKAGSEVDSKAGSEVDSESGSEVDSEAGSEVDSESRSDVDSESGSEVDSESGSKENSLIIWGIVGAIVNVYRYIKNTDTEAEKVTVPGVCKAAAVGFGSAAAGYAAQENAMGRMEGEGNTIGSRVGGEVVANRQTKGLAGGAMGGAISAGLIKIVENLLFCGKLSRKEFNVIIKEQGIDDRVGEDIYKFLCDKKIIMNDVVCKKISPSLPFPKHLEEFKENIQSLVNLTYEGNITKGVVDAAHKGAKPGAEIGAAIAVAETTQDTKAVKKQGYAHGKKIMCSGEPAGFIERNAYVSVFLNKLVVHHNDGTRMEYDVSSDEEVEEVHIHYSAKNKHYSPADRDGNIIHLSGGVDGDCFFEAIAYQTGESLAHHVRQKVARLVRDHPERLEKVDINELASGGEYLGGGGGRDYGRRLELKGYNDALIFFDQNAPNLKNYAIKALKDLRDLTVDRLNVLEQHTTRTGSARIGEYNIHVLGGKVEGKGFVAVDVHVPDAAARCDEARMLFRRKQMDSRKLEFIDATVAHGYDKMLIDYFKGKEDEQMINLLSQQTHDLCEDGEQKALGDCGDDQTLMDAVQQTLQEIKRITLNKFEKMKDHDEIKNGLYCVKFSVLVVERREQEKGQGQAGKQERVGGRDSGRDQVQQREFLTVNIECPSQQVPVNMLFEKKKNIQMMLEYVEAHSSHQKMIVKYFDHKHHTERLELKPRETEEEPRETEEKPRETEEEPRETEEEPRETEEEPRETEEEHRETEEEPRETEEEPRETEEEPRETEEEPRETEEEPRETEEEPRGTEEKPRETEEEPRETEEEEPRETEEEPRETEEEPRGTEEEPRGTEEEPRETEMEELCETEKEMKPCETYENESDLEKTSGWGILRAITNVVRTVHAKGDSVTVSDIFEAVDGVITVTKDRKTVRSNVGDEAKMSAGRIEIVRNLLFCGLLTQEDFISIMSEQGIAAIDGIAIYKFLCEERIVMDNVVQRSIPLVSQKFSDFLKELQLEEFEGKIRYLVEVTYEEEVETLKKVAAAHSDKMMHRGEWAGSIESEAYARAYEKRLIVYHDDRPPTEYGSSNDNVHIHYSAEEEHYSPADKDGHIIPLSGGNDGDCFFEAIAYQTGESLAHHVRLKVARFVRDHPEKLENVSIEDLKSGGKFLGGAGGRCELTEKDTTNALASVPPNYKNSVQAALDELGRIPMKQLNTLQQNPTIEAIADHPSKKGRFHIHFLVKDIKDDEDKLVARVKGEGFLAIDFYSQDATSRGLKRMLFKKKRNSSRLKYIDTSLDHGYDKMVLDYYSTRTGKGKHNVVDSFQIVFKLSDEDKEKALSRFSQDQVLTAAVLLEIEKITLESFGRMKRIAKIIKNEDEQCLIEFRVLEVKGKSHGAWVHEEHREFLTVDINHSQLRMLFVKNENITMRLEYVAASTDTRQSHYKMIVHYFGNKGYKRKSLFVKDGKTWHVY